MSYHPLARKYRPSKFSDLVGQEAVAKALAGSITLGRIHPSIIFSGVRGIGKTTLARLMAKALNCENGPTPEPCGVCESCQAITQGSHEDVMEIDGASNNGVDEVRALRETISYVPQRSKYKVYIIDEVHMLSTSAFNALLKTLEEPPPGVVFIFATTELQKVPETVVGRCLTFNLKKMTVETISKRLAFILGEEKIPFEDEAVKLVAREGRGSMRDALTFLDQVIALDEGKVTLASLAGLISNLSSAPYFLLLKSLLQRDAQTCVNVVDQFDQAGLQFTEVVEELAKYARHSFILKDLGRDNSNAYLLDLNDEEVNGLLANMEFAGLLDFNRIFRTLIQCRSELDGSDLDRYVFENYLLEWCFDPGLPDIESLLTGGKLGGSQESTRSNQQQAQDKSGIKHKVSLRLSDNFDETKSSGSLLTSPDPAHIVKKKPLLEQFREEVAQVSQDVQSLKKEIKSEAQQKNEVVKETLGSFGAKQMPATWRDLVDVWKKLKPLQARKLEEVHPLEYTASKIVVAVDKNSMIGPTLLQESTQKSLEKVFSELFGFSGEFRAVEKEISKLSEGELPDNLIEPIEPIQATVEKKMELPEPKDLAGSEGTAPDLPNNILQDRSAEIQSKRADVISSVKSHELTRAILDEFSGTIVDVKITNPTLIDLESGSI
jgi:DNA polymerase III subunit gamma/tau